MRSLCADVGERLGMGAHLTGLVRTRSGRFSIEESVSLEQLANMTVASRVGQALMPTSEALSDFPMVLINEAESARIRHGNHVSCPASLANNTSDLVRVHDTGGRLLAVARIAAGVLKPELVFS